MGAAVVSGGAYNYLYIEACEGGDLGSRRHDIADMERRLQSSGYYAAARSTREVARMLDAAGRIAESLRDVWKAVEWADSGDSSEERVREAVEKFSPWPPRVPGEAAGS